MRGIVGLKSVARQLELAGEMRSATREILKRIYEYIKKYKVDRIPLIRKDQNLNTFVNAVINIIEQSTV